MIVTRPFNPYNTDTITDTSPDTIQLLTEVAVALAVLNRYSFICTSDQAARLLVASACTDLGIELAATQTHIVCTTTAHRVTQRLAENAARVRNGVMTGRAWYQSLMTALTLVPPLAIFATAIEGLAQLYLSKTHGPEDPKWSMMFLPRLSADLETIGWNGIPTKYGHLFGAASPN